MLLFGRARSRLRLLCPRSVRRLRPAVSRVTGPTFPACICLPPFPLLFRIQRRGRPQLPARRIGCELVAKWVHGRLDHLHVFMPKHPRERSNRPWPTSLYLAARLGNCSETAPMGDSELSVCRHSRALNLGEQYFRARVSAAPGAARHGGGRAVAAVIDDAASDKGEYEYDDHGYDDQ